MFKVEDVPVYFAMLVVVPLTFDAIRVVLEDKLDFDVIINRNMLRALEALIAVMIFPSAVVFIILIIVHYVVRKSFRMASEAMEFLSMPCFFSTVGFYISLVGMFLMIQVVIILVLKFIYKAL